MSAHYQKPRRDEEETLKDLNRMLLISSFLLLLVFLFSF